MPFPSKFAVRRLSATAHAKAASKVRHSLSPCQGSIESAWAPGCHSASCRCAWVPSSLVIIISAVCTQAVALMVIVVLGVYTIRSGPNHTHDQWGQVLKLRWHPDKFQVLGLHCHSPPMDWFSGAPLIMTCLAHAAVRFRSGQGVQAFGLCLIVASPYMGLKHACAGLICPMHLSKSTGAPWPLPSKI